MSKPDNLSLDNNFQVLHKLLTEQYSLSEQDSYDVFSRFHLVEADKNTSLHRQGEVCRHGYFICQGAVRTYFINKKGDENIRYIAFENDFVSAFSSFITQTPSLENVETLEVSKLLRIKQEDFKYLVNNNPTFEKLYLHSLEQAQVFSTWRLESMLSMTAGERYEDLLQRMPALILRLSNKQVASFLGITQESLSRLKAGK
jgi:CRP-like cAMP-binding protein